MAASPKMLAGVVVVLVLVGLARGCEIPGDSGKFQANQTGSYPGAYWWDVSPCVAGINDCSGSGMPAAVYVRQYDPEGNCDPNLLNCADAPTNVTQTDYGYVLNFTCVKSVYGVKFAIVNVTCGPGSLRLVGEGIPITSETYNSMDIYTYTFNMTGGACSPPTPAPAPAPYPYPNPSPGPSCDAGDSGKFQANQTGLYPGVYWWDVSPCVAGINDCSGSGMPAAYVRQYVIEGNCDLIWLNCADAPTNVTQTDYGYVLNFTCAKTLNGVKIAIVNITCGKGPLRLVGDVIPVTSDYYKDIYTYTFNMTGACSPPPYEAPHTPHVTHRK